MYRIEGARLILKDRVEEGTVCISNGHIVDDCAANAKVIDGRGLTLAPALVDVHGDAFERQVMPRPGVFFPTDAALLDTDRQLAANGIATAYHALTLSWEPGLRALDRGEAMIDGLARLAPRLTVENRVQLRWETFAFEAEPIIQKALAGPLTPSIAFNDHTSMSMRSFDVSIQERPFELSEAFVAADLRDPRMVKRVEGKAKRSGLSVAAYLEMKEQVYARRPQVDAAIRRIAEAGRAKGAPMLSHDDTQVETRAYYRAVGARITEFPMRVEVAHEARAAGDAIVFGAPNVVRGGSHIGGSPSAADMVEAGLCDMLASDYFYPAMLAAVARLHHERRAPLPDLWRLVSGGPAAASGLSDRGEIAPGKRADLVALDWPEGQAPRVVLTLSGGRVAYMAGDLIG